MSVHHENIRILATQTFLNAWGNTLPLIFPNDGQEKPSTGAWARFTISTGETNNAALSGFLKRTPLVFGAQIYMPLHKGTKEAYQAADILLGLENKNFISDDELTVLKTGTATVQDGGVKDGYKIFAVTMSGIADTEIKETISTLPKYLSPDGSSYFQPGGIFLYNQPLP